MKINSEKRLIGVYKVSGDSVAIQKAEIDQAVVQIKQERLLMIISPMAFAVQGTT
jgi:hypothetical protein